MSGGQPASSARKNRHSPDSVSSAIATTFDNVIMIFSPTFTYLRFAGLATLAVSAAPSGPRTVMVPFFCRSHRRLQAVAAEWQRLR